MNSAKIILALLAAGFILGLLFLNISTNNPPSTTPPPTATSPPKSQISKFIIEAYANLKPLYEGEINIVLNRTIGEYLAERSVLFNSTCISVHCIGVNKSIGFYVNNEPNTEFDKYIPKNKDRLLIWFVDKSA